MNAMLAGVRRRLCSGLLLALAIGGSGCTSLPRGRTLALPGGGVVTVYQSAALAAAADPGPLVVLQSGLGDGSAVWTELAHRIRARHPVFGYDRPGYGASAGSASARDPCSVATELRALLRAAGLAPPYLLVGHSLGGLYQHAFARLYPHDVAGVLLLDPTHPDHWAMLQAQAPAVATALRGLRLTVFSAAARREFDDQAQCRERLVGPPLVPRPTRLLVSTRRSAIEQGAFIAILERQRKDWLVLTGAARVEPVADAGHYLQTERPDPVAAAIDALAAATAR